MPADKAVSAVTWMLLIIVLLTSNFFSALLLNALEHSVFSVCCFPSYCLLIPLIKFNDKNCN